MAGGRCGRLTKSLADQKIRYIVKADCATFCSSSVNIFPSNAYGTAGFPKKIPDSHAQLLSRQAQQLQHG
nr:hypothetical protein CFP56_03336 [Quercus suber]